MTSISVIIPACNEAAYIGPCIASVLAQDWPGAPIASREIIVAANGCDDATASHARAEADRATAAGWGLTVLDIPEPGKPNALNRADAAATGDIRVYLDADVTCGPGLIPAIAEALSGAAPAYASGALRVAPAQSWITRRYAAIWTRLPFMSKGVTGAGLFAVNAAGRARWDAFPSIISDDTFARLHFTPAERIAVDASYLWPLPEGWRNLVRVRRRQNRGVAEIARKFPDLVRNEGKPPLTLAAIARLLAGAPVSFCAYVAVIVAVRLRPGEEAWSRGR